MSVIKKTSMKSPFANLQANTDEDKRLYTILKKNILYKFKLNFIIILLFTVSCSSDDRENAATQEQIIIGNWKPYAYEYKGKIYIVDECEKRGQLLINNDMSGVYEKYIKSSENCTNTASFNGQWIYDKNTLILTLTYKENGMTKTLVKQVEDFSDSELRIIDTSVDLDNNPGNDQAILTFTK